MTKTEIKSDRVKGVTDRDRGIQTILKKVRETGRERDRDRETKADRS